MLGFRSPQLLPTPFFFSKSKPIPHLLPLQNPNFSSLSTTHIISQTPNPINFRIYAKNGSSDGKTNGYEGKVGNGRSGFNLRLVELVLDPDPDNIVAVGLVGLLAWASVQILWQLFVISAGILLAGLKYTIVAALLVIILITLL